MDLRRLRVGEWITAISGVVLLVSLFLPWWSFPADLSGEGAFLQAATGTTRWSAWEVLSVTDVLLALLALWAIATWAIVVRAPSTAPGIASQTLLVPVALVMSVICLIRVLNVPEALEIPSQVGLSAETEYGAWLGLAATLAVLVGALVGMRDERLSRPDRPTDQTGVPVAAAPAVEKLPGPPPA